jgi:hypothetical protein
VPPPVRGAHARSTPSVLPDESHGNFRSIPKIDFPKFDGVCPKLWQQRCEDYFALYGTQRSLWITIATMQFEGAAARWLQSVQRKLPSTTWEEFCGWIVVRFGRNQHQALLRQLYHIHQDTTVVDYVDRFSGLMDQLAAYEPHLDTIHFTTRFLDGLHPQIRAVIAIQCPRDLDTAYSLALLQEEIGDGRTWQQHRVPQLAAPPQVLALPAPRRLLPLPAPPAQRLSGVPDIKHPSPAANTSATTTSTDDKWSALRQYRRAQGLCYTCGERWFKEHQCKATVQLHVLQEVLGLFPSEVGDSDQASSSGTAAELQLMLADTVLKEPSHLTFKINGNIQGHDL